MNDIWLKLKPMLQFLSSKLVEKFKGIFKASDLFHCKVDQVFLVIFFLEYNPIKEIGLKKTELTCIVLL